MPHIIHYLYICSTVTSIVSVLKCWYMKEIVTSSGGIVLREMGGELYVALAYEPDKGISKWAIPKGHVESGESIEQTALREIKEETGLTKVRLLTYLGEIRRLSNKDTGEIINKNIHIFLVYSLEDGNGFIFGKDDVVDVNMMWFTPRDAYTAITIKEDRRFLKDQLRYIDIFTTYLPGEV